MTPYSVREADISLYTSLIIQYLVVNISLYYIQDFSPDDSTAPSTTCNNTIDVSQLGRQPQQLTQQP